MATRITKRVVDAALPGEKEAFLWDSEVKGFGLKVTPGGGKIYVVQFRTREGRSRRFTMGRHGSPWTPDAARGEALRILRQVAEGRDPQAEKEVARQPHAGTTVAEVFETFMKRHADHLRAGREYRVAFNNDVLPYWGAWPIERVAKRDIILMLDRIADRGTSVRANRVLAYVRKFFNWCLSRDLIQASPCQGVKPPAAERTRDRVLSDEELRLVWLAAGATDYPFGPCIRLLILTGQRRDEVAGMRWSELDLEKALWTIPAERAKNNEEHYVHLSPAALAIIRAVPKISGQDLLLTTTGRTAISGFGKVKERLDALILKQRQDEARERGESPDEVKPLADWRFHDFRRTATTVMAQIGIAPHVADKILNHKQGTIRGVAAVYNRFQYLEERKQALDAWADRLEQIVSGDPTNVVPLRRPAASA